jgi:beta-lactamase class A
MMLAALFLAQVAFPTMLPTANTAPVTATSESAAFDKVAADAVSRARALGATLGVVIIDLATGTSASRNADQVMPMQSVQNIAIALLIYRATDAGALPSAPVSAALDAMLVRDDHEAAGLLLDQLGGVGDANVALAKLGLSGITIGENGSGTASAHALAQLLSGLQDESLLTGAPRKKLLDQLAGALASPGRLRAGFPNATRVEHESGTSGDGGFADTTNDNGLISLRNRTLLVVAMLHEARGDARARDAIIASLARGAYEATNQFPI